jgi:hypothetical protein
MSEQTDKDAADREREMQEHEREAVRRDESESSPGERDAEDDPTKPAPPGSTPNVTGQP